jgi:hypothetical protein
MVRIDMKDRNSFFIALVNVLGIIFPVYAMASERSEQRTRSSSIGYSSRDKNDSSNISDENIRKAYTSMATRLDSFDLEDDVAQSCKSSLLTTMINHLEKTNKDS